MNGQTLSVEEIAKSVAEQIADKLKLQPGAFLDRLVKSLTKDLTSKIENKQLSIKATPTSVAQEQKLPNASVKTSDNALLNGLPKLLTEMSGIGSLLAKIAKTSSPNLLEQNPIKQVDSEEPTSKLEKKEEPKPFLFAGFTPAGLKDLQENLPEIIKKSIKEAITETASKSNKKKQGGEMEFPEMGIVTGALGVLSIIGGVFTLLYGLQTDGQFKGLAKLAGKGMLEIGRILTKPLTEFSTTITDVLIKIPLEKIKVFGTAIKDLFKTLGGALDFGLKINKALFSPITNIFKTIGENLLDATTNAFKSFGSSIAGLFGKLKTATVDVGSKLLSPLTDIIKGFGEKLIEVPMKLIKSFGSSITGLFEKVGGTAIGSAVSGLGKITGFLPKMLSGLTSFLKKIPIVGTLISLSYAMSRFKSGDYLGGGIDILSGIAAIVPGIGTAMSIGLDALNAFLDIKTGGATAKQQGAKIDLLKGMGDWIAEKIVMLPVIGPLVKAVQHLAAREWKKGLKQLAYVVPVIDGIAAFMGDEDASATAKAFAGTVQSVNWSEIGGWLAEKLQEVPIIGPMIRAIQYIKSGEYLKGLKQLAYINPAFEAIGGLMGDNEAGAVSTAIADWGVDLVTDLSKWIIDSLSEMINIKALKDNILNSATEAWESRPTWMGGKGAQASELSAPAEDTQSATSTMKRVGDAKIKPDGGLVVSSPTEGSLFQLSKNDGIVAAPVSNNDNLSKNNPVSFGKMESILETIASNTGTTNGNLAGLINGFNNLAKALKDSGTIEKAPVVVNNTPAPQKQTPKSVQVANLGNSDISNFRMGLIEPSRFQPA